MKVLTIAHNAVAPSNRRRLDALAALPDVHTTLLTPPSWYEEGRHIDVPRDAGWRVGRTLATGNGTRHVYLSGLFESVRQLRPDVIDLFEEPFSLVALQTLFARDLLAPHAALVFYSAVNVDRRWRQPYRTIEHVVLRRADGAHAPSVDVPPILRRKGMAGAPIEVVPLGVDADRFAHAAPLALDSIARPRIGFLGRLEPVKGLDVLLNAFSRMAADASLVVAGDGSLHAQVRARCDGRRTHLLPSVPFEEVPNFLRALDVLVLPSVTIPPLHREQFGRVLIEAMAAGVPVIGSSSGGIPEVIGDAGLVVPERDPVALAESMQRVLDDAGLRQTLIERGRRRVRGHFDWAVVAARTADLFRSALGYRRNARTRLAEVRA
jgi:glycosyltransferase involved in cell wall biosynthesis